MSWLRRIDAKAGFEFVVDMDDFDDLEWWDSAPRGLVDYWTSYERKELHIVIRGESL